MQKSLIEIPCKIGDTVYGIRKHYGSYKAEKTQVSEMYFTNDMKLVVVAKHVCRGLMGENVFLSEEEAQAKARKLRGNKNG